MSMSLGKKHKYLILAALTVLLLVLFSYSSSMSRMLITAIIVTLSILGPIWVQYPGVNLNNSLNLILIPLHLVMGAVLSLIYFPNLGVPTRLAAIVTVGVLMYVVSLTNNIFMVSEESKKTIPLFRVAVTWSQILLVIVSIPYLAGVYKTSFNFIIQNLIAGTSAFLFSIYMYWPREIDKDVHKIEVKEKVINSLYVMLLVVGAGVSVSFFPTESFLRSLYVSAILMSVLGYFQAHYKNAITKKLLSEYLLISLLFLFIVILFR